MVSLSDYYISIYAKEKDQESQKNERKKVSNLVKKIRNSPKIFGCLAFDYLFVEEQARLVHFFLEECSQRQVMDNLKKTNIDVDFDYLLLDNQATIRSAVKDYCPIYIDDCIFQIRDIIRNPEQNSGEIVINDLQSINDQLYQALLKEYVMHEAIGIKLEWPDYVKEYIDFIDNCFFQFFNYRIMKKLPSSEVTSLLKKLCDRTDCLIESFDKSFGAKYKKVHGDSGCLADKSMLYFKAFIMHRNRLFQYFDVYQTLIMEMKNNPELFSEVPAEYVADKILISEEDVQSSVIKTIVTENETIPNYEKKLALVREFINFMHDYAGRDCYANCIQDIKVYFRELYISKQPYCRQKSAKIVEDYLKLFKQAKEDDKFILPNFNKESQYIFVREKISRGYFREKNLSAVYVANQELREKVYTLLLRSYWLADSRAAIDLLHGYNKELLSCLSNIE